MRSPPMDTGLDGARVNGLAVLVVIVLVGLVTGAGFYRYERARMEESLARDLAAAPSSPAERAALWLQLSGPQIHHRLAVVGRFSPELPWLVTHAVAQPDGGAPEIWGVDCALLPKDLAHLEGLTVVVELPRPVALGRVALSGAGSQRVPLYAADASLDPTQRLEELARYLLEGVPAALERDVPGATLVFRTAAATR